MPRAGAQQMFAEQNRPQWPNGKREKRQFFTELTAPDRNESSLMWTIYTREFPNADQCTCLCRYSVWLSTGEQVMALIPRLNPISTSEHLKPSALSSHHVTNRPTESYFGSKIYKKIYKILTLRLYVKCCSSKLVCDLLPMTLFNYGWQFLRPLLQPQILSLNK